MHLSTLIWTCLISFLPFKQEKNLSNALKHPIYISVSEVNFNPKDKTLEITHKIFIDDFEQAIENVYGIDLRLGTERQYVQSDSLIGEYASEHFMLQLDDSELPMNYLGSEHDLEAIWIYQEVAGIEVMGTCKVYCNFLFDLFDDQKNIVHLDYQKEKRSFLFRKGDAPETCEFP